VVSAKRITNVFCVSRVPSGTQALAVQHHGLVWAVARGKTFKIQIDTRRFQNRASDVLVALFWLVETALRSTGFGDECDRGTPGPHEIRDVITTNGAYCSVSMERFTRDSIGVESKRKRSKKKQFETNYLDLSRFSGFLGLDPGVVNYVGTCYFGVAGASDLKRNYTLKTVKFKLFECKVDVKNWSTDTNASCWNIEKHLKTCR
jgi:hypothetical protein